MVVIIRSCSYPTSHAISRIISIISESERSETIQISKSDSSPLSPCARAESDNSRHRNMAANPFCKFFKNLSVFRVHRVSPPLVSVASLTDYYQQDESGSDSAYAGIHHQHIPLVTDRKFQLRDRQTFRREFWHKYKIHLQYQKESQHCLFEV